MKLSKVIFYWENGEQTIIEGEDAESIHQFLNKHLEKGEPLIL